MRGCFVTATDTGVGKTVLAAAIVASARAQGIAVRPVKPVITGLDEPSDPDWPHDHELLARAAGCTPEEVNLVGFGPPVSPHLAAALAERPLDPRALAARIRALPADGETLVVEGVGGLLVPLAGRYDVRQLAADIGLPLVIAARPGLGTINHTLLTLEAARRAGLAVLGVALTPWQDQPDEVARSNRATIEELGGVPVHVLPSIARADPELLAAAAAALPVRQWLG